jgi:predicted dinucleotide-binding enzyme
VVAVAWNGLEAALSLIGAASGSLAGKTVLDCTNPADYATGRLIPGSGSAAEIVAGTAAGAHVVKALHMFAGASWPFTGERAPAPVVAICGDDPSALEHARSLIADLGGRTAMIGTLASARQAEEAAGFVMRVVAVGANPRFAVPDVNPALLGITETVNN